MMKKSILFALVLSLTLTSCAMVTRQPVNGWIYSDVTADWAVTESEVATKMGKAKCQSILGLFATGDASIDAACRQGQIQKIHHVDFYANSILGVVATYEVRVYGT